MPFDQNPNQYPQDVRELLETPEYFKLWLLSRDPEACVGKPGNAVDCAIARFVKEVTNQHGFAISPQCAIDTKNQLQSTPAAWVVEFIQKFDEFGCIEFASPTTKQALECLEGAPVAVTV